MLNLFSLHSAEITICRVIFDAETACQHSVRPSDTLKYFRIYQFKINTQDKSSPIAYRSKAAWICDKLMWIPQRVSKFDADDRYYHHQHDASGGWALAQCLICSLLLTRNKKSSSMFKESNCFEITEFWWNEVNLGTTLSCSIGKHLWDVIAVFRKVNFQIFANSRFNAKENTSHSISSELCKNRQHTLYKQSFHC